jgi:sugar lactone lactonase YvrE
MPTVGEGHYTYEVVPSWPNVPKYWSLGMASDGAVNSKDEVHIFSRGLHPLTIWTPEGDFISSWGEGHFSANPHGIYIAPNDNVWLVDRDFHIATEYTPSGDELRTFGEKLAPSPSFVGEPFNMPSGLAIAPDGNIFVSDGYGGHRVHKFSPEGELLLSWGRQGTRPGEFALLHNLWVDSRGRVLICDRENHRIQVFDGKGRFETQWCDNLHRPCALYMETLDNGAKPVCYIGELGPGASQNGAYPNIGHRIVIRDADGIELGRFGDPIMGEGPGQFIAPHGICLDSNRNLYVAEVSWTIMGWRLDPPREMRSLQKLVKLD